MTPGLAAYFELERRGISVDIDRRTDEVILKPTRLVKPEVLALVRANKAAIVAAVFTDVTWLVETDYGTSKRAAECWAGTCDCGDEPDDEHCSVTWTYDTVGTRSTNPSRYTERDAVITAEKKSTIDQSSCFDDDDLWRIRNMRTGETRYVKAEITTSTRRTADTKVNTTIITHRWTVADEKLPVRLPETKEGRYYLNRAGDFLCREVKSSTAWRGSRERTVRWHSSTLEGATGFVQLPAALQNACEQQADLYDARTGKTLTYKGLVAFGSLNMSTNKNGKYETDFAGISKLVRNLEAQGEDAFTGLSGLVEAEEVRTEASC